MGILDLVWLRPWQCLPLVGGPVRRSEEKPSGSQNHRRVARRFLRSQPVASALDLRSGATPAERKKSSTTEIALARSVMFLNGPTGGHFGHVDKWLDTAPGVPAGTAIYRKSGSSPPPPRGYRGRPLKTAHHLSHHTAPRPTPVTPASVMPRLKGRRQPRRALGAPGPARPRERPRDPVPRISRTAPPQGPIDRSRTAQGTFRWSNLRRSQLPSASQPPSTRSSMPFTKPLSFGSARKAIASAISVGLAKRAIGTRFSISASL